MTKDICFVGMPGLYQNWLVGAIDPTVVTTPNSSSNFWSGSDRIHWLDKFNSDLTNFPPGKIINSYVKDQNFAWYLYNFLEKTDDVRILVDNLEETLFTLAPDTVAFDHMLKHFVSSYNITTTVDKHTIKNMLIEYFYFLLIDLESDFKKKSQLIIPNATNIELRDFENVHRLIELLDTDTEHVEYVNKHYQKLYIRNKRYIDKRQQFVVNYKNMCLDIIEIAYIGYLITQHTSQKLDWYNENIRQQTINEFKEHIINWHLAHDTN